MAKEDCPCLHNEAAYKPGEVIKVDCNTWCVEGPRRVGGVGRHHGSSWPWASALPLDSAQGLASSAQQMAGPVKAAPMTAGLHPGHRVLWRAGGKSMTQGVGCGTPEPRAPCFVSPWSPEGVQHHLPLYGRSAGSVSLSQHRLPLPTAPAGAAGGSAATGPAWAPAWPTGTATSSPSTVSATASRGAASTRWHRYAAPPRPRP